MCDVLRLVAISSGVHGVCIGSLLTTFMYSEHTWPRLYATQGLTQASSACAKSGFEEAFSEAVNTQQQ